MIHAHQSISQMCSKLGEDRLLVQGAGGNVSWKDQDTLWIKGSGTWLANANNQDIFVPVDLKALQDALASLNYDVTPKSIGQQALRPSIETILHALMPHKIVVHLHAINPLSYLVKYDCQKSIDAICEKFSLNAAFVSYHKPGPELAQAIHQSLQNKPRANVVLLQNHGIVIGGESVDEIYSLLEKIIQAFAPDNQVANAQPICEISSQNSDYLAFADEEVQALAFSPDLFKRLSTEWVLFPDHAVFLGAKANVYQSWDHFERSNESPELIFIKDAGVFVKPQFNQAKTAQLRCYFDVINLVNPNTPLQPLSEAAISALLNWDAEKLRQQMSQK